MGPETCCGCPARTGKIASIQGPIFGFRALTADGGAIRFRAQANKTPEFKRKRIDEGSCAGKAGGRLQRQGPRQERRNGRRTGQRQDVDESVRRNRRRGSTAPEGSRQGDRSGGGVDRPGAGLGDDPDRSRHGRRPRHPSQGRRQCGALGGRQDSQGDFRCGKARPDHSRQAGDRRRFEPDRPDAGGPARMVAGDLCLQARSRRRRLQGHARSRRRPADREAEGAGDRHYRFAAERAALRLVAQHHEGEEEADRRQERGRLRRRSHAASRSAQDVRTARPQGRRQGQGRRRADLETQDRSRGSLMTTLLIAEHDNASIKDATNKALTAAAALGAEVHVLVAGENAKGAADAAAKLAGVTKVLLADNAAYAHDLAEPLAALIVALAPSYDAFVAPATSRFKNVMPRVAALLDVMQVSEIIKVISPDTFERPIYAGNAIQTVKSKDAKKVITVRTSTFAAAGDGGSAPVENAASAADPGLSSFVGEEVAKSDRPELTSAKIIVSGGRAMQSRENFSKYIEPLADKLGAGVGASRAAVDAGYAPNDWQVGQTGKVVAPELYVAIGISGAIQDLAGMKDSKVIVAINNDEQSPIFQVADYGLVADLYQAVPELTEALGKLGK